MKIYSFSVITDGEESLLQYYAYTYEQALYFLSLDGYLESDIVEAYCCGIASI